jgi:hypothetical protein
MIVLEIRRGMVLAKLRAAAKAAAKAAEGTTESTNIFKAAFRGKSKYAVAPSDSAAGGGDVYPPVQNPYDLLAARAAAGQCEVSPVKPGAEHDPAPVVAQPLADRARRGSNDSASSVDTMAT